MSRRNKVLDKIFDNLYIGIVSVTLLIAFGRFTIYRVSPYKNLQFGDVVGGVTVFLWGLRILSRREWKRVSLDAINVIGIIFVLLMILTSLFSKLTLEGIQNLLGLVYFISLFLAVRGLIDTKDKLIGVTLAWAAGASVASMHGLYENFIAAGNIFSFLKSPPRLAGLFQHSAHFAAYLSMGILAAAGLAAVNPSTSLGFTQDRSLKVDGERRTINPRLKKVLLAFIFLELFTLFHTVSITGYVCVAVGLIYVLHLVPLLFIIGGTYFLVSTRTLGFVPCLAVISPVFLFHRTTRRYAPVLISLCCLVFLLPHPARERIRNFVLSPLRDSGVSERMITDSLAMKLTLEHPIKGVGVENGYAIQKEHYRQNFRGEWVVSDVHNTYLSISSEAGIFSLAAFLLFISLIIKRLWRGYKVCDDVRVRNILYACLIVLLVTLLNLFLRVGLYWRFFWIFLALSLCADKILLAQNKTIY